MITAAQELLIRGDIVESVELATGFRVIPAPIYFGGKEDYWATDETVILDTQDEIENAVIKACWVYLKGFDDAEDTAPDSPAVNYHFDLYLFEQYDSVRVDENVTPDAFNKKMLGTHNEFIQAMLNLKIAFQGYRNLGVLDPVTFAEQQTTSLSVVEEIQNKAECVFIPGIAGHQITLRQSVRVRLVAC